MTETETAPETAPAPIAAGTFAIYALPDGGALLVTEMPDGEGGTRTDRKAIPAMIFRMFTSAGQGGGGVIGRKLRAMMAGAGDGAGDDVPAEVEEG